MRTTLRRAATFLTLFLALAFVVTLANQTAQLVELAARAHPVAGEATLWGLVFLYAACLGVPAVLWLRLPPALDSPDAYESGNLGSTVKNDLRGDRWTNEMS